MNMRHIAIILTAAVTAAAAFGQQPDNNNPNRDRERFERMRAASRAMNYGNWVGRQAMEKEFMDKVGLNDEQAAKLKEGLEKIEAELKTINESIDKMAAEQAEIARKVLAEPGADIEGMMKLIERIGQLRTEQAKLSTKVLVVIRDTLTEDQRKKAQELIATEGQRRAADRGAGFRPGGGENRPGMEGQGPRPGGPRPEGGRRGGPGGQRPPAAPGAPDAPPRPDAPKGW